MNSSFKENCRRWILPLALSIGLFSGNVSHAIVYTWTNGATSGSTNVTNINSWTPVATNGFYLNSANNGLIFTNYYSQGDAQTFNWAAVKVGVTNQIVTGYTKNVIFTNVEEWRFMAGAVTLTNSSGLSGTNAGTLYIYNTMNSQLGNSSQTFAGNMAFYLGDISGHTSSSRTLTQNLPSLCISNLGVTMANSSQLFTPGTMTANLTFSGSGTSTVIGSLYVSRLTSFTNSYTNNSALTVGGTGTFNLASTNAINVSTTSNAYAGVSGGIYGWNSGLIITNSASVYVAGQRSLGAQAWDVKIGTTNAGKTTFGVFTNNEWATNSTTSVSLTNNFAIANSGAGTNIFKAQTGNTLILGGTISGSVNGTVVADAGTLVLSGANTALSLPFRVTNSGTLVASNNSALGLSSVTVASGATLKVNAAIANSVTNNGGVTIADGGSLVSSNFYSVSGSLSIGATAPNTASFNGSLGSWTNTVGALSLTGNGNLELSVTRGINSSGLVAISSIGNFITVTGTANVGTNNLVVGTSLTGASASSISLNGSGVGSPSAPIALGSSYTASDGTKYTFTNSATALQLVVVSNLDSDGDGVMDSREIADGTNPNDASSYNSLSKGLVAYYPFNGNYEDESGNGMHLTIRSGASLVNGPSGSGNAVRLAPTSYAETAVNAGISQNASRTISFWFTSDGPQPHPQGYAVGLGSFGNQQNGNSSYISIDSSKSNGIIFVDNDYRNIWSATVPELHQRWHHVVWSYQDNLAGSKIYIDGQVFPSSPEQAGTTILKTPDGPIKLGRRDGIGFQGVLDNVRIYNRAISSVEVGQLYQHEVGNLDSDGDGLTDAWERGYGRYQIIPGSFTATQAKADAAARGGAMATFTSSAEWQSYLAIYGPIATDVRIGLEASNTDSTGWAWVTGEAGTFRNWDSGQPEGGWGTAENTTVVYSNNSNPLNIWHDFPDNWGLGNFNYLLEFGYPTDSMKADTDGDGFNDSIESYYRTDPNNAAVTPNTIRPAGRLAAWGTTNYNFHLPPTNLVVDVSARGTGLAVTAQGSLVAWGRNTAGETNQVPSGITNAVQVAAGHTHCVALKGDGTVVSWGDLNNGLSNVPAGLKAVQVAASWRNSAAVAADGKVYVWGVDYDGQMPVPTTATNARQVAVGWGHVLVLKQDGTVMGWGRNIDGERNIPAGLTNVVQVGAQDTISWALKRDGGVAVWGRNSGGIQSVPGDLGFVTKLAGGDTMMAIGTNGNLRLWGSNIPGDRSIPAGISNVVAASLGDAPVIITTNLGSSPVFTSTNSFLGQVGVAFSNTVTASGTAPIIFGGSNLPTGLNITTNGLVSGTPSSAGTNSVVFTASNSYGVATQTNNFVIAKGTPVISSWPIASAITYGQTLSNSVLSGGVANPAGNFTWTVLTNRPNAGTNLQSVTFTPTATSNYNSVTNTVSLVVNKTAPVLTWTPSPAAGLTYPASLSSTQLNATSSVAGTFSYNPTNGTVLNAGTNTLVGTSRRPTPQTIPRGE